LKHVSEVRVTFEPAIPSKEGSQIANEKKAQLKTETPSSEWNPPDRRRKSK